MMSSSDIHRAAIGLPVAKFKAQQQKIPQPPKRLRSAFIIFSAEKHKEIKEKLASEGISITVINSPFVNSPDVEAVREALKETSGKLISYEDHQVIGGMGSLLSHSLGLARVEFQMKSLGQKGGYGQSAYTAKELYDLNKIGVQDLIEAVKSFTS